MLLRTLPFLTTVTLSTFGECTGKTLSTAACCSLTSDLAVYDKNRRLLYDALTSFGFEAVFPDGAFYLFVKSPEPDAAAFCEKAKKRELLFVPSDDFGCPGYVRIAYCVSTDQITRSLPAFELLAKDCGLRG